MLPTAVAIPRNRDELIQIVRETDVPLIARGSGTGISGGCLGEGWIIDTSKFLNQILLINSDFAHCEPGVIQDQLNRTLPGYRLGPDTSTGDRATLGGMVANNAAGARSLYFGAMVDAIEEIELILSNGDLVLLKALSEEEWNQKLLLPSREGEIYRTLDHIRKTKKALIEEKFPPLPRRSSGYLLNELLKPFPLNLAKLIAGSEGTLGIIVSLKVKMVPKLKNTELHLFPFSTMLEAMHAVGPLLKTEPISLEMIDDKILNAGRSSPLLRGKLKWLKSVPKALLIAEYSHPAKENGEMVLSDPLEIQHVWELRKAGLGLLLSKRSYSRAVAFIEDVSVPPEALPEFMDAFLLYLKSKGKEAGIYGHVGPGCLHIRPYMDLRNPNEVELIKTMMLDVAEMLKKAKGAPSGEHGDGLIRSWLNPSFFGKEIETIFQDIKAAFDPENRMNPHKIVNPLPIEKLLRRAPKHNPATFLHFDGGLALAADLCNGNGACRKTEGVMCPSFQVTHDEYDSTRARANVLRKLLQNNGDLTDQSLHDILDLCIQCKGCKTECPSQVDMAKMKSEALFHYQEKNGYSLRNALFAYFDILSKWGYPFKGLIKNIPLKWLPIAHPLPQFAKERFSYRAKNRLQPKGEKVVLLSDTYTEFYCPEVGMAAISVLNSLGFEAIVPPWKCCGRPALSKGFLHHAKANAERLYKELSQYQIPIIGLEPSCLFTLLDEYQDLIGWRPENCLFFDDFLAHHSPLPFQITRKAALHGHCHQKALKGMSSTLKALQGYSVTEIPSGCCGMAGSFGYEQEHVHFSKQIAELVLLPSIRSLPNDLDIIANGFSCRTQIELYTGRKALHLAEWLNLL